MPSINDGTGCPRAHCDRLYVAPTGVEYGATGGGTGTGAEVVAVGNGTVLQGGPGIVRTTFSA